MAKEVEEFCAICGTKVKMPIVQEDGEEPGFLWVQCPNCHEIKPLETRAGADLAEGAAPAGEEAGRRSLLPRRGVEAGARSGESAGVRTYRPGEAFEPGDILYHPQWKDTGKVVSKKDSGGGRRIIVVEFEKMGQRKLVMEAEHRK